MERASWVQAVDRLMQRDWSIGVEDAGVDEAQLDQGWRDGDAPVAFVAWFAEKYDLIRFEVSPVRNAPSKPRPPA